MKILHVSIIIGITVIAIIISISMIESNQKNPIATIAIKPNQQNVSGGLAPSGIFILDTIAKTPISSEQEASAKIGQSIKFPTYLPAGYKIQISNVDEQIKSVIILASPDSVTPQTTRDDFITKQKGVSIYIEPILTGFNETSWTNLWLQQNSGSKIQVNGLDGVAHDIMQRKTSDETVTEPASLTFFKNDQMIEVSAMLPLVELIKIAQTL